jgi:hypothetical protein
VGAFLPWPVFSAIEALSHHAPRLLARLLPPPLLLLDIATGHIHAQALAALARLGAADALGASGPRSAAALGAELGVDPDVLHRLLRCASSRGVFHEDAPGVWRNNRASGLLRAAHPASFRSLVLHFGDESFAPHAHALTLAAAAPGGRDAHPHAFAAVHGGQMMWEFLDLADNNARAANFNDAMAGLSRICDQSIVADVDWGRFGAATVADVGGGVGGALAAILRAHPRLRGVLLDRASVVAEARGNWAARHADLLSRVELREGSFFEAADIPAADVYFSRFITHDW